MRPSAGPLVLRSLGLLVSAVLLVFVGIAEATPKNPGAAPLGLPSQSSILFTLNAEAGTMRPTKAAAGHDRYRLDLTGIDDRAVWFADRPRRDAGRLRTARFLGGWGSLGFRADPPNAALVTRIGHRTRTVAVELRLRGFSRREHTASFDARVLGSLGGGLNHLNQPLGAVPAGKFEAPTLFVDNGGSEPRCTLGETRLLPVASGSKVNLPGMIPAEGQTLNVGRYGAFFALVEYAYGGNGANLFGVPKLASPTGTTYYICAEGFFPSGGETLTSTCTVGETDFWALPNGIGAVTQWAPADGRKVPVTAVPEYAARFARSGETQVALPSVTAPPGLIALTCLSSPEGTESSPILGQLDLLPSLQPNQAKNWLPLEGSTVPQGTPLSVLLAANPVLRGSPPALPPAGSGATWFISTVGSWPLG